jgi:hypothetical protein
LAVAAVTADDRYGASGRVRPLVAYDSGLVPPPRPVDGPGSRLVTAGIDQLMDAVTVQCAAFIAGQTKAGRSVMCWTRHLLRWLEEFSGDSWEQRWLASGADTAPRRWAQVASAAGVGSRQDHAATAASALLIARVLRPSYSWLLNTHFHALFERFPQVNDPDAFARLRALPGYLEVVPRLQLDAEAALVRVMIRTGKPLMALTGEDLLRYADLVAASGRPRREHLAWELMIGLGGFLGEPPTLRAVWTAKGNSKQHSAAGLVDRYGLPDSEVRALLVEYLTEVRPGLDYASWENIAHTLGWVFWRTIVDINPQQADLRLSPDVAAVWRERVAVTRAGAPRQEIHSLLFTVRAFYRDISQWALEDPGRWARWAAPQPGARDRPAGCAEGEKGSGRRACSSAPEPSHRCYPSWLTKRGHAATGPPGCWPQRPRPRTNRR